MGARVVIVFGALGVAAILPVMAVGSNVPVLAGALFLFGFCLGSVDVAANIHGTVVQSRAGRSLMSGFHGWYSVGGLLGAVVMTTALSWGLGVELSALAAGSIVFLCTTVAGGRLMQTKAPSLGRRAGIPRLCPHGLVVAFGFMALLIFLVEGAILDWSAVLLHEYRNVPLHSSGGAYVAFAVAMAVARLVGDRLVAAAGGHETLLVGSGLTLVGVAIAAYGEGYTTIILGFGLAGLGAGNIVPVVFSLAGSQKVMPAEAAIVIVSTLGYLGVFMGPAAVGYLAAYTDLPSAFGTLAALMAIVAACACLIRARFTAIAPDVPLHDDEQRSSV